MKSKRSGNVLGMESEGVDFASTKESFLFINCTYVSQE
ncbi:hypothetical protein J2S16_001054 [Cytobacillus kochii]|nr:hypothetical protein [Cytobacillus kochii]